MEGDFKRFYARQLINILGRKVSLPYENATSGASALDLTGKRFGLWTVLCKAQGRKWNCRCDCGQESAVGGTQLRQGLSTRCKSCANRGRVFKHGLASAAKPFPRKYRAWLSMLGRVRDRSSPRARWYNSVTVCPEWAADYAAFDRDVPDPADESMTLDRIDNARGYEPGNVRWATMKEQARNRRNNRMVTINGRTQCLAAWAEELGINEATLRYRLTRGKTVLEAAQEQKMLPAPMEAANG